MYPRPRSFARRASRAGPSSALTLAVVVVGASLAPRLARATPPTPGYPEPVLQWGVQKGETCEDIARSLYGSPKFAALLQRYNHIGCKAGAPLREGITLVVPATATNLPDARLRSMNPDVRARPGGGSWAAAATGMPLYSNYNVNTLDQGRADVEFIDRTRVFLAPNTLVVIYGTASQTRVSKTAPVVVEVEEGEVKAGLAALRGGSVDVAVKGGGVVTATSRDTVVQQKGARTTVAVFDGKAKVSSGGRAVEVPERFGTRFVGVKPPDPPRPLPPPPVWAADTSPNALAMPGAKGVVTVSWQAAKNASAYRVELFREGGAEPVIVTRTEVPSSTTSFRGELGPGSYRLAVRTIDTEEYLGVAASVDILVVAARPTGAGARLEPGVIDANPYGELELAAGSNLEMAIDGGAFGPLAPKIDLVRVHPKEIQLRDKDRGTIFPITIRYEDAAATFVNPPELGSGSLVVRVAIPAAEGVDAATRVRPVARLRLPDGVKTADLHAAPSGSGNFEASFSVATVPPGTRVDIVDGYGKVLGSTEIAVPAPAKVPPVATLGPYAPLWPASPVTDTLSIAPTAVDGAAVSAVLVKGATGWGAQGQARASGSLGPVGLDAAIRSTSTDGSAALASAWLGARVRLGRAGDPLVGRALDGAFVSSFEGALAVRALIPTFPTGEPMQLEPVLAAAGGVERFTWLADVGGRARLSTGADVTSVPKGQGYVLGGAAFDATAWLRLHALLDAHVVVLDEGDLLLRGGLELGLEAGTSIFGGLGARLTPWPDAGSSAFMGALTLGYRAR